MGRQEQDSTQTALRALSEGYQPVPIQAGGKRPYGSDWTRNRYEDTEEGRAALTERFTEAREKGAPGVGLLLGKPSGGLVDIDLDHPLTLRLARHFLPPTPMIHGRLSRSSSHFWYQVKDLENLPDTRRYKMPDGSVSVELRSTGGQTVIPPTVHPSGETYQWELEPFGGEIGPYQIDGRKLAIQVAMLGLAAVVLENFPRKGSRHEAYLNLAGGFLRFGEGVHPYWERNLPVLIAAIADASHDEEGASQRVHEVMDSTVRKLNEGRKVGGFPKLAEIIGEDHAEMIRRMAREVESLSGFSPETARQHPGGEDYLDKHPVVSAQDSANHIDEEGQIVSTLPPEERNPMEERISSWVPVDLDPYLAGEITLPEPTVLRREDGAGLFYPGRVNMLFGASESAKSWILLACCKQEMERGERVVYLDLEDEPAGTLSRMVTMGTSHDDIRTQFRYVHPEGALAPMQRGSYGSKVTELGRQNFEHFQNFLQDFDPTLVVVDGMTVLYGLHGLDTNDAMSTDVITSWLKSLTRGGRSSVIVIDHTGKASGQGASPIGAHHKIAMIQGTALRADAITRPMPGDIGKVDLVVYKDRPGAVRAVSTKHTEEQVACQVILDSKTYEGETHIRFTVPDHTEIVIGNTPTQQKELLRLGNVQENINNVLELFAGDMDKRLSTKEVQEFLQIPVAEVYDVWKTLTSEGRVKPVGSTRNRKYMLKDRNNTGGRV